MKRIIPLVILAAFLLSACAPRVEYLSLSGASHKKTNPREIRIYDQTLPGEAFQEIGIVRVEGKSGQDLNFLIGMLRERASEHGAHAVILRDPKEGRAGYMAGGSTSVAKKKNLLQGTAIRFKGQPKEPDETSEMC